MTQNVDINAQRHAEHLRQLYLAEKQESKDLAINNQVCPFNIKYHVLTQFRHRTVGHTCPTEVALFPKMHL